ncbi:MAG TPA: DinB family protein [Pyrinomonadaceae bacterium]|nr:DinB family protein [Pyrinomonadaceae bacterium]HMP65709.1 DinB family protein [Pyrinomonadaceae bacterium]
MEFDLERSQELLSATPGMLRAWLGELSDEWIASAGDMENWMPYDVLGHLISAEEGGWIPRARQILEAEGGEPPEVIAFDRDAFFEASKGKGLIELLAEFDAKRSESLETLRSWELSPDKLELKGIHPEFGEVTLSQLLSTWVVHDLTHIRQIATAMARKLDGEVGPWRAYLSILR